MALGLVPFPFFVTHCCALPAFLATVVFRGRVSPRLGRTLLSWTLEFPHLVGAGDTLRLWALLIGPQVPEPSMYFPTAMTWCAGTTLSSVATMTRRSGSGTAGDRHGPWVVLAGRAVEPRGSVAVAPPMGSFWPWSLRVQCTTSLVALG